MEHWKDFQSFLSGLNPIYFWVAMFVIAGFVTTVFRSFFQARKIQPKGFKWKKFRREIFWATVNLLTSGFLIGGLTGLLSKAGFIQFHDGPASWWVIALEYVFYFFAFDAYFYWFHRLMHVEPVYTLIHKIHHGSISPNVLTTLSVSPFESLVNGGFLPLFTAAVTLHHGTMAFIGPTFIIMGVYVHSGYEFLPRWWYKSWLTKWFITATFHDQHHRYFKGNYGGFTTIWDFLCGTVRPKFLEDFDALKARSAKPQPVPVAVDEAKHSEA